MNWSNVITDKLLLFIWLSFTGLLIFPREMCWSQVHTQFSVFTWVTMARSRASADMEKNCNRFGKAGVDALDYLYFQQFSFKESSSFVQSRLKWRLLISGKIKRTEQVKRIVHWGGYFCFNNVLLQQLKLKSKQAWALHFIMVKASTVPLGSSQLASFVFNSYCPVESDNMAHNE